MIFPNIAKRGATLEAERLTKPAIAPLYSEMAAASLRALLERSIDYAGMFPPCSLELEPALTNQARYVRLPDRWMLNAFVLPVAKFDAAKQFLSQFDPMHPLSISALGPRTENATTFREALVDTDAAIRSLSAHNVDLVSINQLEMFLPGDVEANLLDEARSILGTLPAFWEAPPERAQQTIGLLAEHNSNVDHPTFGYKMRTGGVTADAFPTSAQIAAALVTPATHQVPIKFTAGLHHPLRQYRDEVQTKMHGFLNVLGAAVLAAEHKWDAAQTTEMLEDEAVGSFKFDDESFAWRDWKIDIRRLKDRRRCVTSFGSCSFDEPRDDLHALKLL
jgi:hypothetical protein